MSCGFLPIDRCAHLMRAHVHCAHLIPEGGSFFPFSPFDVRRQAALHFDVRTREQLRETVVVEVWSRQSVKFLSEPHHQLHRRVCRRRLASLSKQGMQGDWQDLAEEVPTENSIFWSHRAKDALPVEQRWVCSERACRRQRANVCVISFAVYPCPIT